MIVPTATSDDRSATGPLSEGVEASPHPSWASRGGVRARAPLRPVCFALRWMPGYDNPARA